MVFGMIEVLTWLIPVSLRTNATNHLIVDIILNHKPYSSTVYASCRSTILPLAGTTGVFLWTRWWNLEFLTRRMSVTGRINHSVCWWWNLPMCTAWKRVGVVRWRHSSSHSTLGHWRKVGGSEQIITAQFLVCDPQVCLRHRASFSTAQIPASNIKSLVYICVI